MKQILILVFLFTNTLLSAQDYIYKTLIPVKCDSLIKANATNPGFVIMDVRTPAEYIPQHIEGAINRNYYDSDFDILLDSLDHEKIYLIHCKSGSRSGKVFKKMKDKKFKEVYNMQGGILFWKNSSLPVVSVFYPKIMLATDSIFPMKNIKTGDIDTINITITNRANDTLKYSDFTSLTGTEFSTDFNISKIQLGAQDYSFNIYYQPEDDITDSLTFTIESNGGTVNINIIRSGYTTSNTGNILANGLNIYPNPVKDILKIENLSNTNAEILIMNYQGKTVYSFSLTGQKKEIDISGFQEGFYFVSIFNSQFFTTKKIIVNH